MTQARPAGMLLAATLLLGPCAAVRAETDTDSGGPPGGNLSATARLDFTLNIGKFIFLRVGTGAYPTASGTVDQVSFLLQPTIPPAALPNANVSSGAVTWSGAPPTFAVVSGGNVVPVEVRSNAGQVSLRATVSAGLVSGANTIPMSDISVSSTDVNLPAPPIPNSGTGAAVTVAGTSFGNLVTARSATWTFGYAPAVLPAPGTYNGQLSFTASSP